MRALLRRLGKNQTHVVAVFAATPEDCDRAVRHVSGTVPVWLFTNCRPWPATERMCERVLPPAGVQRALWPRWVALSVAAWTGRRGHWKLKVMPLFVPPFRGLILNGSGDFFAARPAAIARHVWRAWRDAAHSGWNRSKDITWGICRWLFASPAKHYSFLSRWMFRPGCEPLAVHAESQGEGVEIHRHPHRKWDWRAVDRLVSTSSARWLLFLEGSSEPFPIPEQIDPDCFAISRQIGYRGWKACLFPTAPFRQLQPGEISRVLAPVSNAIYVDRAKLAALGVPDTIVSGTTWLVLFWQAAAAGWSCYSVGGDTPVKELPDWPYEEAEFVTNVRANPDLRPLGPRQPDLSRGSIATIPGLRCTATPAVLVVSPYLPYPLSHGGAVRIWNLCRALAGRAGFILACFHEKGDTVEYEKLREVFSEIYVVDRDEHASGDDTLPKQVREHESRSMRALIADLAPRVDLQQVEYTHMAGFRHPGLKSILVEHDLTFTLYRQLRSAEYERWLAFERRWFRGYDGIWTMSGQDRQTALDEGSPAERTWVVANGVDLERFVPREEPGPHPEIFYVGSFRHLPNVLGFEKLCSEVMPRVWKRFPEARLRVIAGPDSQRYWNGKTDSRVIIHGFVADLRPHYASATVVVVPLLVSAGTNIKVMEAMACGKAVVTTPVGCAGLGLQDGADAVIREDWGEFAEATADLLADAGARERIAAAARATVERRFGWSAIAESAWASYQELLGDRRHVV